MDLQIKVFRPAKQDKPVFRESVLNLPVCFSYETIVESLKLIYGDTCIIQFNII